MKIKTLTVGYKIDNFIFRMCQKKFYKQGFDICKYFALKKSGFRQWQAVKLGYFSLMKHFGLKLLTQSVVCAYTQ